MSYKIVKEEKGILKAEINITKEDFNGEIKNIFNENKKVFKIPGFRNGKVPFDMVVKFYGIEIFYEDATKRALNTEILDFITKESGNYKLAEDVEPTINVEEVSKDTGVKATLEFVLLPEVKLPKYTGIKVSTTKEKVTAKKVNEVLEQEAKKNARLVPSKKAAENGDVVTIDFEGFKLEEGKETPFDGGKAEKYDLKLGSQTFIPGFEEQLVGLNVNDQKDVLVTFPQNYNHDALAGKEAKFKVLVHEIKKEELPKIDDEFAKDLGFDTLDEYKADIKKNLEEAAKNRYDANIREDILDTLVKEAKLEVPEKIVESRLNQYVDGMNQQYAQLGITLEQMLMYSGKTLEEFKNESRVGISKQIASDLLLTEIAKKEKLEPKDDEVDEALEQYSKRYKAETTVEELRKHSQLVQNITNSLKVKMAMDLLVEKSVTKTEKVEKEDKTVKEDKPKKSTKKEKGE